MIISTASVATDPIPSDKFSCFTFNMQCNNCGKWYHCRSAPSHNPAPQAQSRDYHAPKTAVRFRNSKFNRVHELNTTLDPPDDTFYCETVDDVTQKGEIFGQIKLKVDTGAKCIYSICPTTTPQLT